MVSNQDNEKIQSPDISTTKNTAESASTTPPLIPRVKRQFGTSNNNNDFTGFEKDERLIAMFKNDKSLRLKLQSIYGLCLEPPDDAVQPRQNMMRGRGRGRGRGMGNRGFGGRDHERTRSSQWTQAKGNSEALTKLTTMRDDYGEESGVAEFIKLVGLRCDDAIRQNI